MRSCNIVKAHTHFHSLSKRDKDDVTSYETFHVFFLKFQLNNKLLFPYFVNDKRRKTLFSSVRRRKQISHTDKDEGVGNNRINKH